MRLLLDENLPRDLAAELTGHQVTTVQAIGWSGTTNGELLRRAGERFDALLTMDRGLQYQYNLGNVGVAIVIIRARSNRMTDLEPLVDDILHVLPDMSAGQVREIGA